MLYRRLSLLLALAAIVGAVPVMLAVAPAPAKDPTRTAAERVRIARVTALATDFSKPEAYELRPGGATTTFASVTADVFSQASANIRFDKELDFKVGNGIFKKLWVSAPSSTKSSDGLGPLFNARSCQRCHLKDGRGHLPGPGEAAVSFFLRLSIPAETEAHRDLLKRRRVAVIAEPTYGTQLQNFSVQGIFAEGQPTVRYTDKPVTLKGGQVVVLRQPTYGVTGLRYGPLHPRTRLSPRLTPQMIGVGLLEAILEEDILALADPDDRNGDGISGKPNYVWSVEAGRPMLGRFGWKAGQPSIREQVASAFLGDIGISTPIHPRPWGDCTAKETACRKAPHGGGRTGIEATKQMLDLVTFYSRNLAVPARRKVGDPTVLRGKKAFYAAGCAACHRPKFVTRRDSIGPEQSFQLIWPYTDMLLHDMGPGLADGAREGLASGREWRTAPLWGIGLARIVNPRTSFLHDGRARTLLEAVLWHGGEGEKSKQAVVDMDPADREALIAFLRSL